MLINLNKKKILIGITGSISIYKTCEIIRLFIKSNAEVYVVMTEDAIKFISPILFEGLTRNKVLCKDTESWSSYLNHIDIGQKCDIFLIAPATMNTINKIANGISDNILLQTILAFSKKILIAPSTNTNMLLNEISKNSIEKLQKLKYIFIKSQKKILACGTEGDGALAEPIEIFYEVSKSLLSNDFWADRNVIVTSGGTVEKIDDVRYISNFSTGKMGNSLALSLYLRGAKVTLLSSANNSNMPNGIKIIKFKSSQELYENLEEVIKKLDKTKKPYIFMLSAVSDFIPEYRKGKIKKNENEDNLNLSLKKNIDILLNIDKKNTVSIGFKLEMNKEKSTQSAINSLNSKKIDAICLNILKDSNDFEKDSNNILFITQNNKIDLGTNSKINLSFKILDESSKLDGQK